MTHRDAFMFPLIASGALLGLYIVFKVVCINGILLCLLCFRRSELGFKGNLLKYHFHVTEKLLTKLIYPQPVLNSNNSTL